MGEVMWAPTLVLLWAPTWSSAFFFELEDNHFAGRSTIENMLISHEPKPFQTHEHDPKITVSKIEDVFVLLGPPSHLEEDTENKIFM